MKKNLVVLSAVAGLLLSTAFLSCQKDPSGTGGGTVNVIGSAIPAATPVTGSVAGIVVDANNNPLANVEVTVSGTIYQTDSKGFFNTKQHTLDKYISTIKITKAGYFTNYRSFCATAAKNYMLVKMVAKTLVGTFNTTTGVQLSLPNGTQLNFPANGIVEKASGLAYSGTVNVYSTYVDPTSSDITATMPGSAMGQDATKMYFLNAMGIIAVELESASATALQLSAGKPVSLKLAIPSSLQANAPSALTSWSLNDRGIWIKEGAATKNGSFYEFQVSHFSWWSSNIPNTSLFLDIHLVDQNSVALGNTRINIVEATPNPVGHSGGYTDNFGNATACLPAGPAFTLSVYPTIFSCSSPLYTQAIGPYSTNSATTITANLPAANVLTVNGVVQDCSGNAVQNGFVVISTGPYTCSYANIVNGIFSTQLTHCAPISSASVYVVDNNAQQMGTVANFTITGNVLNTGTLSACGTAASEFINYTLDGINYTLNSSDTASHLLGSSSGALIVLGGQHSVAAKKIWLTTYAAYPGTYLFPTGYQQSVNNFVTTSPQAGSNIIFTNVGWLAGEFFEGSFSLYFKDNLNVNHTCTGAFKIKKQ